MRMDQFTVKAQEAIAAAQTAAEKSDHPEVTPEHLLQALVDPGGRRRARRPGQDGRARRPPSLQDLERALAALPRTQGAATQLSPKLDAVFKARAARGGGAQGPVRLHRAPPARARRRKTLAGEILKRHGVTRDALLDGAARDPRQPARRPTPTRRTATRRSRSTAATSPSWRARASSTPSSAATTRCAAWCRCCPAAPRTTPCSSASRAWARPRSWRASPSASSPATCRSR